MSPRRIRPMTMEEFPYFYKQIEQDFASDEYQPYSVMRHQLQYGIQEGLVFTGEQGDLAYAIVSESPTNGFVLVSLLAVLRSARGQGVGTAFLQALSNRYAHTQALILEVERPDKTHSAKEKLLREKRIAFYQRSDFYQVPEIEHYSIWGVPMYLMALPIRASKQRINANILPVMNQLYRPILGERYMHQMQLSLCVAK